MYKFTGFSLLLGEDDKCDVRVMEKVFEDMGYNGEYTHLALGQDVIDWTLKQNQFVDTNYAVPNLIILDIGLPGVNGIEVLKTLREDDRSKHIPILMCSGSVSQRDYYQCIALGCNAYIQKNAELDEFTRVCSLFIEAWWYVSQLKYY